LSDITADEEMYKENILDHYKEPHNKGKLENPTVTHNELNPVCGDMITIHLKIEDKIIKDVTFTGSGCAISQSSVSMLTDELKGKTLEEFHKLNKDYIYELLGIPISPNRMKCALLSLKTAQGAIQKYEARS